MAFDDQPKPKHDTVLDVTAEQLSRTYAQAFLGAANESGAAESAVAELSSVVDEVIRPNPQLLEALKSAFISHEERVGLLDRILGGRVSDLVLNTLKVLSAHNRLGVVASVAQQARKLFNDQQGRVTVEVTSATPLAGELVAEIGETLRSRLGIDPVLETEVDESLIAGLSIRVGDTVYDSSLKNTFNKSRQAMVEAAIARIEADAGKFFSGAAPSTE